MHSLRGKSVSDYTVTLAPRISELLEWGWCGNAREGLVDIAMTMTVEDQLAVAIALPTHKRATFAQICKDANVRREGARRFTEDLKRDWALCLGHSIKMAAVAKACRAKSPMDLLEALR
jgi:hypothetical protein